MIRHTVHSRENHTELLEEIGFSFHTVDGIPYWNEGTAYELSKDEVDELDDVATELHQMCLKGVQYVIDNKMYDRIKINPKLIPFIEKSWEQQKPTLIGRMDFTFKEGIPKMMEYNADTPASLIESAWAQWSWLEDYIEFTGDTSLSQFNMLSENIQKTLIKMKIKDCTLTGFFDIDEDHENVQYMQGLMELVGINTTMIDIRDLQMVGDRFMTEDYVEISNLYKLYPLEQLVEDEGFDKINYNTLNIIEPWWKAIISNKAFMCILWELFPDHKNLIPSYFENKFGDNGYVKKPIYSREGSDVTIYTADGIISGDENGYGEEGYIYQEFIPLPEFYGAYAMLGVWIIGGEASGIGIREDNTLVTRNSAMFVPHYFKDV